MATIGQVLSTPEAGWKRYDDTSPAFKYVGTWNTLNNGDNVAFQGGEMRYTSNGDTTSNVQFTFYGTKIRLFGQRYSDRTSDGRISIDAAAEESFVEYASAASSGPVLNYEKTGLTLGYHTVKIRNNDAKYVLFDGIDIDSTGRLLHPDEVTDPAQLTIGKRLRANYSAASGAFGAFGGVGQETSNFIPAASSATPNGDFYLIYVDDDNRGRKILIADRNVQNSISWDTLNTAGVAEGGLPYTINAVPLMSSATNGSVTISGSENQTGYEPWRSFDRATFAGGAKYYSMLNATGWLKADFGSGNTKTIAKYTIKIIDGGSYTARAPKTWTFEGSNDNTNWTVLDTRSSETGWASGEKRAYVIPGANIAAYRYYRLNISARNGDTECDIDEMELIESINMNYSFTTRLLASGTVYSDTDDEWDKYIVNSTLNGTITAGDNNVWNWSGTYSWASTTHTSGSGNRTGRGNTSVSALGGIVSSTATVASSGFRPVLVVQAIPRYLFQDGTSIKAYTPGTGLTNIATGLTGSSGTAGTADASSSAGAGYEPWRAFDTAGDYGTTSWASKTGTGAIPAWLRFTFPTAKVITKYGFAGDKTGYPTAWTFEGSNDGTTWTVLDTHSGMTNMYNQIFYYTISNTTAYTQYRLNISGNSAGITSWVYVYSLELYANVPGYWTTVGTAPATEAIFTASGMSDLTGINNTAIQALVSSTPSLLTYIPDALSHSAAVTAVPNTKVVIQNNDIWLASMDKLNSVTLTNTLSGAGNIRVAVSVDGGKTWQTFGGGNWSVIDITNTSTFAANGLTASALGTIIQTDWMKLWPYQTSTPGSVIRFAYLIDMAVSTDTAAVSNVTFNMNMRGLWNMAILGTDYKYSYLDGVELKVTIQSNGDYKINY